MFPLVYVQLVSVPPDSWFVDLCARWGKDHASENPGG